VKENPTPDERAAFVATLRELRTDLRSLRELFEGYRERLEAEALRRERCRRRINRLSLGLLARR
jgi:hypothetical protein